MGLSPRLLKAQFYIIFGGVNLTFFPMHFLGLAGMPRRYSDYPDSYFFWNMVSRIGSRVSLVAVILFLAILWDALRASRPALASRFNHTSLEAFHPCPPLSHSYPASPQLFG